MFFKLPGSVHNEVSSSVNWDTVVFFNDPLTGNIQMAEQKMLAPPKNPFGMDMGGLQGGKASSVSCDLDRIKAKGVPPLTYAEVKQIFDLSASKKIPLGEATVVLKGKDAFMPAVLARFIGKGDNLARAWFEGCKTAASTEAPISAKTAGAARRKLIPNENGFAPAPA